MNKFNSIKFFLLTLIFTSNIAVASSNTITIFGNDTKPPKYFLENNIPKGILIDIMKYIEKNMNFSFNITLCPWKRAYQQSLSSAGGVIGLSKNAERLKIFDYSDVMYYDDLMLVVLKGEEFIFENIEDLKGKTLGVERGASYGDEFEMGKKSIFKIDEDNNSANRLKKLLAKRFDVALVGPGKIGVYQLIKQDKTLTERKDELVILPKPFKRDPNYLGFSKTMKMKNFLIDFNKVLEKGKQDGTIRKIIANYAD